MTQRVDKDSLPLNQPRRTPGHPDKSHIVKTKVDGKEKLIRFGEQGASTAGKPKEGESDRMKAKRASFKSRHAKNIAKGPSSPAYWANKVKWADGGSVRLNYAQGDSVRVTPQNAALGSIANFLKQSYAPQRTQQMQGMMEFLGVPAVARTVERMSYGQPITNLNKANVPLLPEDTAETAMLVGPMAGPLARAGKAVGKAGARVVGEELNRAILDNSGVLAKAVPQAAKPMYVVPPQGNLNLTPMARAEVLKGPEVQTPENFLNQLRNRPGMTQEGFDDLAKRYQGLEPNTRMTKAEFEQNIPASQYNKVDLVNSAESADAHLRQQAEELVMEDQQNIYEGVADRLGARASRDNMRMLYDYHNGYSEFSGLPPDLQQSLRRAGMDTPEGRARIDDVFAEERENAINNVYQNLRDEDYGFIDDEPGGYTYSTYQRLLENPDATESGYFELGVSHPDQMGGYTHYPSHGGEDGGLIGHVRGTFIPADAVDDARKLINPVLSSDEVMLAKPNSMVIEEIQSDAQKGKAQSGVLRQAHGTVFKAAIQHALENGVDTVYYPTAKAIGGVRLKESSKYAPIYDQQIVKEGLKPLLKIPGVDANKIGDAYYEINFTPEAKDFILKGEGQSAPGYAGGGLVKGAVKNLNEMVRKYMAKEAPEAAVEETIKAAPKEHVMLQGLYRGYAGEQQPAAREFFLTPQKRVADFYAKKRSAQTGAEPHADMVLVPQNAGEVYGHGTIGMPEWGFPEPMFTNARRKIAPADIKSRTPLYAEGGSVSAYDPMQVDDVMNSINAPRGYEEGGRVQGPDIEFSEDPEALRLYNYAMKQATINPGESASGVGAGVRARLGGGDFSAGFDMNRMTQGERDQMMRSLATGYNINLGDLNLDARVQKPLEAQDVYIGMLNGSIPLKTGRAMLGVQGIKTPQGSDVLGYNVGWSGKVGPGRLSANLNQPKRGGRSAQVQYQIPFAEGGSVTAYDSGRVDAILNQFM